MPDIVSHSELRKTWEAAAPGWAKWERVVAEGLSAATDVLFDMAGVRPGMRVLDLACGAGSQTLALAGRVGPEGRVVACDISATMLEHLRRNAAAAGLDNIETRQCAAEELDAGPEPFDAAISRLGLMLFPEPGSAVGAVKRALKRGSRFAALVFTTPATNLFMSKTMAILLRHAGKSPPAPGRPGIFALGADGVLESLLRDNGLSDVETRTIKATVRLPSADAAFTMMQEAFGAYRAVVADLGEAERAKAWDEVRDCLASFETADGFSAELEFRIGAGVA